MRALTLFLVSIWLSGPVFAALTQHFEIYGAKSREDLVSVKSLGFDQVMIEKDGLLDTAQDMGFRIVLGNWFDTYTLPSHILSRFQLAATVKNLVSVNLMDEPMHNGFTDHPSDLYLNIRQTALKDGFHFPLSITEYGPRPSWKPEEIKQFQSYFPAIDLVRIAVFPVLIGKPLSEVHNWIARARKLMESRLLPITVVLQAWHDEIDSNGIPHLPTPAQLRVMLYLAVLNEVQTVSFFDYNPVVWNKVPGFKENFTQVMREVTAFSKSMQNAVVKLEEPNPGFFKGTLLGGNSCKTVWINSNDKSFETFSAYEIRTTSEACSYKSPGTLFP